MDENLKGWIFRASVQYLPGRCRLYLGKPWLFLTLVSLCSVSTWLHFREYVTNNSGLFGIDKFTLSPNSLYPPTKKTKQTKKKAFEVQVSLKHPQPINNAFFYKGVPNLPKVRISEIPMTTELKFLQRIVGLY